MAKEAKAKKRTSNPGLVVWAIAVGCFTIPVVIAIPFCLPWALRYSLIAVGLGVLALIAVVLLWEFSGIDADSHHALDNGCATVVIFLLLASIFSGSAGGILASNRKHNHHQVVQHARLLVIAKDLIAGENSLYQRYGSYSQNLVLDVYPLRPALEHRLQVAKFTARVSDNSIVSGKSILVTITAVSSPEGDYFRLILRDGKVEVAGCSAPWRVGCIDGKWSLAP